MGSFLQGMDGRKRRTSAGIIFSWWQKNGAEFS
jgi:hypothetical protein